MAGRKHRPADVELLLRKEAGFGCCKCGRPIYVYHHIVEYSTDQHYRPEDMMILCPNCHDEVTKGAIKEDEQRRYKASPFNLKRGLTAGPLKINQDDLIVDVGSNSFRLPVNGDVLRVDGEPLLSLSKNPDGGLELSLEVYDNHDNVLVRIKNNEWISRQEASVWDIESDIQYLRVRQRKGDIRLEITAKQDTIQLRANLWRKGENIVLGPRELLFKTGLLSFQNIIFEGCFNLDSRTKQLSFMQP